MNKCMKKLLGIVLSFAILCSVTPTKISATNSVDYAINTNEFEILKTTEYCVFYTPESVSDYVPEGAIIKDAYKALRDDSINILYEYNGDIYYDSYFDDGTVILDDLNNNISTMSIENTSETVEYIMSDVLLSQI